MTAPADAAPALPPPPIPAHVDMAGNDWFPLHHQKLTDSAWWLTASHLARSCQIDLLIKAYRQVPAGSLPDDERELAVACGLHRDMDAFRAVRAELLETWTLCADGRWYQPFLAAVCLETWERKQEDRRKAREKQARRRQEMAARMAAVPGESPVTPPAVTGDIATQDRTGQDTTAGDADPVVPAAPKPAGGWRGDGPFVQAWDACTDRMRMRSRSREQTWPIWKRAAARCGGGERLLAAVRAYLRADGDVERTGGPGFHKWLADGVWEHWLGGSGGAAGPPPDPLEEWRLRVSEWRINGYWPGSAGPRPGEEGCRCPAEVTAGFNHGTRRT